MSDAGIPNPRARRLVASGADLAALAVWACYALALTAYWPATVSRDFVRHHRLLHDLLRVLYVGLPGVLLGAFLYSRRTRHRAKARSLSTATLFSLGTSLILRLVGELTRIALEPFAGAINRATGFLFVTGFILEAVYLASFCSLPVIALVVAMHRQEPRAESLRSGSDEASSFDA